MQLILDTLRYPIFHSDVLEIAAKHWATDIVFAADTMHGAIEMKQHYRKISNIRHTKSPN